ncbi:CRAL-TRIO domain-containing protein C3H8.02-like [Patiria miniata]|uniref:CRAL-TRIO domain-containing protein n=1 Tax=Patiria miniata TaxID=46514 RepID=A0A913ZWC8_PATMI|nr:CRAL-TRIO domain-containing protein C3H8.02-like [Patiria miniata]XP_038055371.1 CRAL-TRIO domain-containing protein C3H8.02-like [Patiria miniata]
MGNPIEYDPNELVKLKERCEIIFNADPSQYLTEPSIIRFLKAFKNVDDSFAAILKCNQWRKDYGVETISPTSCPEVNAELNTGKVELLRHRDRHGRPMIMLRVRHHKVAERNKEVLTKCMVYILESACKKCNEDVIDNVCVLFDMRKFSLASMDYEFVKTLIWLLSTRYPERLGVCLIINAPMVFQGCWAIIRPMLSDITAQKVVFINDDMALANYLCPDALPENPFEEVS